MHLTQPASCTNRRYCIEKAYILYILCLYALASVLGGKNAPRTDAKQIWDDDELKFLRFARNICRSSDNTSVVRLNFRYLLSQLGYNEFKACGVFIRLHLRSSRVALKHQDVALLLQLFQFYTKRTQLSSFRFKLCFCVRVLRRRAYSLTPSRLAASGTGGIQKPPAAPVGRIRGGGRSPRLSFCFFRESDRASS